MTTVPTLLREARELIAQGWTQHAFARDAQGEICAASEAVATCWCIRGAVRRVCLTGESSESPLWGKVLHTLSTTLGRGGLAEWNDAPERTKEEVLSLFDRAIEKA